MLEPLAQIVTHAITRSAAAHAVGWVFAYDGHWGVFLAEQSNDPAWPPGTTYLEAGTRVTLPPFAWRLADGDGACGWVNQDGGPLSRPLLLHPILTLVATEITCSVSPTPEA